MLFLSKFSDFKYLKIKMTLGGTKLCSVKGVVIISQQIGMYTKNT